MNPIKKPEDYYVKTRDELLALLPKSSTLKRVLDLGCGSGATGQRLKEKYGAQYVVGVELEPVVAREAERVLDEVIVSDIDEIDLRSLSGDFDLIVLADILEHLRDPWAVLDRLRVLLKPGGYMLASLPNVQHWRTVMKLLGGEWHYRSGGTLDITHLRFFTADTMRRLFEGADLRIVKRISKMGWEVKVLDQLTFGLLRGFFTYQFLFLVQKA
jgi:2-polyprenyl-3-methyl-5-hydroxy-6-metoxy-1,4-benzoquinol methylase